MKNLALAIILLFNRGLGALVLTIAVLCTPAQSQEDIGQLFEAVNALHDAGKFVEAIPLAEKLIKLAENKFGNNNYSTGGALYTAGRVYFGQGRYGEAEATIKRALGIFEKSGPSAQAAVANALGVLGNIFLQQERYAEAAPLFKRSLTINEKLLGPEHQRVAADMGNLGLSYHRAGRSDEAEPLFKRALLVFEKKLGSENMSVAIELKHLADLYLEQGRYHEAEVLFERSVLVREKVQGSYHPDVATGLFSVGRSLALQGRYGEAEPLYERSVVIWEKALGGDHPDVALGLWNRAELALAQQRWADAYALVSRAAAIYVRRNRFHEARLTKSDDAQNSVASVSEVFVGQVRAAFNLAEHDQTQSSALMEDSFRVAQRIADTRAARALTQVATRFAAGDTVLAQLVREHQDLQAQWWIADKALNAALSLAPDLRNGTDERARARLAEIVAALARIEKRLNAEFPRYSALASPDPMAIDEVVKLVGPDEALIQFVLADEEFFVFLVTRTAQRWLRVDQHWTALDGKVQTLRCGLDAVGWDTEQGRKRCSELTGSEPTKDGLLPFNLALAHELYETLFGRLKDDIKGKRLLIVANGPLAILPFGVLVMEKPSDPLPKLPDGYRRVAWLGAHNAITVLPSVSSLNALRMLAKSRAPEPFIGFGDPALRGNSSCGNPAIPVACPGIGQQVAALSDGNARSIRRGVRGTPVQSLFKAGLANVNVLQAQCPLPETSFELKCVAKSLGVPESQIHVRVNATETAVKGAALNRYQIIHFATHGLLASETKQATGSLAEPALLLTPPQRPTEADDGLLTASEISQLRLNADWVVLSACNTAGAGDAVGGEALSGLARAFFYAGARALLVSHWAVDSDAAVLLTTRTFAELKANSTIGRAEALRRAMQAVLGDRSRPEAAHPAFWAPFVVVGEGGR